jgi:glycosyltransferase involved in cell wall biosynthesis
MKISYAITVCNELDEIQRLLKVLLAFKRPEDEIVVLFDHTNGTEEVWNYLLSVEKRLGVLNRLPFKNNFGEWKNKLTNMCTGDYIFQIDADEVITPTMLENLSSILEVNSHVDVFLVPRINTVEGLTQEHINKWRWSVDEKGWVNFPDLQWRIYKNNGKIKWKNKVHEVLEAHTTISQLPHDEEYCLYHPKTIERQEKQNSYYDTL